MLSKESKHKESFNPSTQDVKERNIVDGFHGSWLKEKDSIILQSAQVRDPPTWSHFVLHT
jgi:hypothetical protein